jgi:hypothetical protein
LRGENSCGENRTFPCATPWREISYYQYIDTVETADELPDIIVSADFNAFYGRRFYGRFVKTGHFTGYGRFDPGGISSRRGLSIHGVSMP